MVVFRLFDRDAERFQEVKILRRESIAPCPTVLARRLRARSWAAVPAHSDLSSPPASAERRIPACEYLSPRQRCAQTQKRSHVWLRPIAGQGSAVFGSRIHSVSTPGCARAFSSRFFLHYFRCFAVAIRINIRCYTFVYGAEACWPKTGHRRPCCLRNGPRPRCASRSFHAARSSSGAAADRGLCSAGSRA